MGNGPKTRFMIDSHLARQTIHVRWDPGGVTFIDRKGTVIAERVWPPKGVEHITTTGPAAPPDHAARPRRVTEVLRQDSTLACE